MPEEMPEDKSEEIPDEMSDENSEEISDEKSEEILGEISEERLGEISEDSETLTWTPEAQSKLRNIPYFVRSQARQRIEEIAYDSNSNIVTADIVERARLEFGQ